ncbi:hypothetical protein GSB9_02405 [Flavobacteriaceae bacterium GSB9]|nr:hypothetical protein GSB9_02405 [Flavobacteriaceae bacterium GSB9]
MRSIQCKVFGHDIIVTKQVTYHVKEYKCKVCNKEFTTNSNGRLTVLTPKFKEINEVLERVHNKRLMRSFSEQDLIKPEDLLVFKH